MTCGTLGSSFHSLWPTLPDADVCGRDPPPHLPGSKENIKRGKHMPRYWLCCHLIPCNKFQTMSVGVAAVRPATEQLWVTRDAAQQPAASAIHSQPSLKCEPAWLDWSTREARYKPARVDVRVVTFLGVFCPTDKNIHLVRHQDQRLWRPWARIRLLYVQSGACVNLTDESDFWLTTYVFDSIRGENWSLSVL